MAQGNSRESMSRVFSLTLCVRPALWNFDFLTFSKIKPIKRLKLIKNSSLRVKLKVCVYVNTSVAFWIIYCRVKQNNKNISLRGGAVCRKVNPYSGELWSYKSCLGQARDWSESRCGLELRKELKYLCSFWIIHEDIVWLLMNRILLPQHNGSLCISLCDK